MPRLKDWVSCYWKLMVHRVSIIWLVIRCTTPIMWPMAKLAFWTRVNLALNFLNLLLGGRE